MADKTVQRTVYFFDSNKGEFRTLEAGTELTGDDLKLLEPRKDAQGNELPPLIGEHVFQVAPDHNAPAPLVHPEYDSMTRDELREEVERRNEAGANLEPAGTKKSDYIAALQKQDAASGPGNLGSHEDVVTT